MTEQRKTHQLEGRREYEIMCNLEIASTGQLFMSSSNAKGRCHQMKLKGARCKMLYGLLICGTAHQSML